MSDDLSVEQLEAAMPGRELRSYPATLSVEAQAMAWARAGAPSGALVVAGYQAAARGRDGRPWAIEQGRGLGAAMVLRPRRSVASEAFLYVVATSAVADVLGTRSRLHWPDQVRDENEALLGAVVVCGDAEAGPIEWGVISLFVPEAQPPRASLLARLVEAIEARAEQEPAPLAVDYRGRCATIGRRVRARLVPLGPAGREVAGEAAAVLPNGSLVIQDDAGRRAVVPPQSVGLLEYLPDSFGC